MTRDNFTRTGDGRHTSRRVASRRHAATGRTAGRVRALCLLVCLALLLQPPALVAGRGRARAAVNAPAAAGPILTAAQVTARSLLTIYAGVTAGLRSLAGLLPSGPGAPKGFNAGVAGAGAAAPEPAAAAVLGSPVLSVGVTSDTQVSLSWTPVSGAVAYRLERTPNLLTPYSLVVETPATAFNDGNGVSRGNTFLYRVRAVDGNGVQSPPSVVVMATAITFLDETIVAHVTVVNWQHVDDLRVAVRGVRRAALLPDSSWTYAVAHCVPVRAKDVQGLRDSLNEGLAALGLPTPDFYEPTLQTGANGTPIRKVHFDQLR